ncbi:MAG: MmcQ/YjbR family DNA-binding protein [Paramuribaculum sp.]|nr:MmcQ/YjbR family DNA-binding protein [Paramuribaculum sp.]
MNIESFREYCLELPMTSEDMPFGDDCLIIRVCGKIFACIGLTSSDYVVLKCDPDYAIDLRDRYSDIQPAWHWNKKYWNQHNLDGFLSDDLVKSLIRHSYSEVVKKLPKKIKTEYPQITQIS